VPKDGPPAAVGNASCRSFVGRHGAGGGLSVARVGRRRVGRGQRELSPPHPLRLRSARDSSHRDHLVYDHLYLSPITGLSPITALSLSPCESLFTQC
jgi:hypothetical protein